MPLTFTGWNLFQRAHHKTFGFLAMQTVSMLRLKKKERKKGEVTYFWTRRHMMVKWLMMVAAHGSFVNIDCMNIKYVDIFDLNLVASARRLSVPIDRTFNELKIATFLST